MPCRRSQREGSETPLRASSIDDVVEQRKQRGNQNRFDTVTTATAQYLGFKIKSKHQNSRFYSTDFEDVASKYHVIYHVMDPHRAIALRSSYSICGYLGIKLPREVQVLYLHKIRNPFPA